ncbi:hypothetical protein BDI4_20140 [Burkholderia diffusa]|nr:hypothetical protein BDI4_20140 [Burkholderia diffusa]
MPAPTPHTDNRTNFAQISPTAINEINNKWLAIQSIIPRSHSLKNDSGHRRFSRSVDRITTTLGAPSFQAIESNFGESL